MDWGLVGAIGEILGGVAVVGSLVYVGRQFRHSSTYALETLYFHSVENFSTSSENASVINRGNGDFTKLTEDEKFHFGCIHYNHFSVAEIMYLQAKRGLVHPESIARAMKTCYFYWSQPGFNDFWNSQLKFYLSPEFVEAIESGQQMGDRDTLPTDMGADFFAKRPKGD